MKPLRKGTCRIIKTPAGKRQICRLKNGKVRFKGLGKTTRRRRRRR